MTLSELQFAKRLLDQGTPLEASTIRRILEHAIALAERPHLSAAIRSTPPRPNGAAK